MDILQQIAIKRTTPILTVSPEPFHLSAIELEYLPSVLSEYVNMPIDKATPVVRVGKVYVFDVIPYLNKDPRLVVCGSVDLSGYYFFWRSFHNSWPPGSESRRLMEWDEMVQKLNLSTLDEGEANFLLLEMLRFKNEHIRR